MCLGVSAATPCFAASGLDEFKVKREPVFEFARTPVVTRQGDRVTIEFETMGFCDVTVAIEEAAGTGPGTSAPRRGPAPFPRIVRHLASGVLGPNAPPPFQKDSEKQVIIWDGKNDKGEYIDDKDSLTVRVSLGLKPQFERNLNWSPKRRIDSMPPAMVPAREGVYVYEGCGVDHLRLFDHDGNYIRTIYPFAGDRIDRVRGIAWFDFPQGYRLPVKVGSYQQTFLTSGDSRGQQGFGGMAAQAMAVHPDGRIALVNECLNRLHTDGTTGGRELLGPTDVRLPFRTFGTNADGRLRQVAPTSAAFSPDGKWLYLTGYAWRINWHFDILHGVTRIPYERDGKAEVFVGHMEQNAFGADNAHFNGATSVAVDVEGRVYVSDLSNDRIQVFSPDGTYVKSIKASKPAQVALDPRTQEIYVFSWPVYTRGIRGQTIQPSVTRLGPFDDPKPIASYPLPLPVYRGSHNEWWTRPPLIYRGAVDGWTDPPTIWIAGGVNGHALPWTQYNVRLLREKDGELKVAGDWGKDVVRASGRERYAPFNYQMQRLAVNPTTGHLFLMEPDSGPANKAYKQLVEFDPGTGRLRLVDLPFNCEDLCFDQDGFVYLRSTDVVVRYNSETWAEKPWDYGQDLPSVTCGMYGRAAPATSGLVMPSVSPVCFHQGGMAVSPKGYLAVSCAYRTRDKPRQGEEAPPGYGKPYKPVTYPGRVMSSTGACLHVWDDRGRIVYEDAVQGMPQIDGLGIDNEDMLYVMATPTRILDGKPYFNRCTETMMKLEPGKSRFTSTSDRAQVPLPKDAGPKRPMDVTSYWVEGAKWMYGGVGFAGFNGPGCACWHSRFTLDYFARSFAPEMDQYRVAALDSNGNLIMHIGQYGNVDDGLPLIKALGPPSPRSIGGDEVGLFYGGFLATHTDHRLFIADIGNQRILQVRLDYHTTERVALRDVQDRQP